MDMVNLAEQGLGSVLADNPDLLRHTFRRGELYNSASSSRGVQCQLLATTFASVSSSEASRQLHWTYGPLIYRHLRAVRISRSARYASWLFAFTVLYDQYALYMYVCMYRSCVHVTSAISAILPPRVRTLSRVCYSYNLILIILIKSMTTRSRGLDPQNLWDSLTLLAVGRDQLYTCYMSWPTALYTV